MMLVSPKENMQVKPFKVRCMQTLLVHFLLANKCHIWCQLGKRLTKWFSGSLCISKLCFDVFVCVLPELFIAHPSSFDLGFLLPHQVGQWTIPNGVCHTPGKGSCGSISRVGFPRPDNFVLYHYITKRFFLVTRLHLSLPCIPICLPPSAKPVKRVGDTRWGWIFISQECA